MPHVPRRDLLGAPSPRLLRRYHQQASQAGFDDSFIYRQIELPTESRAIPMFRVEDPDANAPFAAWLAKIDRTGY